MPTSCEMKIMIWQINNIYIYICKIKILYNIIYTYNLPTLFKKQLITFIKTMNIFKYTFLTFSVFMISCKNEMTKSVSPEFNEDNLSSHMSILSSDKFEGRKPGTKGEELTIEYISSALKAMGIESGNGESYFQSVPLLDITGLPSETMTIKTKSGDIQKGL